jgi:hypothetical protein
VGFDRNKIDAQREGCDEWQRLLELHFLGLLGWLSDFRILFYGLVDGDGERAKTVNVSDYLAGVGLNDRTAAAAQRTGLIVSIVVVILVGGYSVYSGAFYITGALYYAACWEKVAKQQGKFEEPQAPDARTAVLWGQCEPITHRGIYEAGMIFSGRAPEGKEDDKLRRLSTACPSNYSDIPIGGAHILGVKLVAAIGGPRLQEHFTPGEWLAGRAFKARWPDCVDERRRQGYPRIIEESGSFRWETSCEPCKKYEADKK